MKERHNQQLVEQDGIGAISTISYDRLIRMYQYALDSIIHTMILSWVFVLFVDGLLATKIGFDRTETMYYSLLLCFLAVRMVVVIIDRFTLLYLIGLAATVLIGILITSPSAQRVIEDFRFLVRSIVLGAFVFWFYRTTSLITYKKVRSLFVFFWFSVTALVLLHFALGIGGVIGGSGKIKPIYTSYFRDYNVVAFSYLLAWFHLYAISESKIKRAAYTVISLVIALLLSSKACALMIIFLLVVFYLFHFTRQSYGRKLFVQSSVVLTAILVVVYWSDIWNWLLLLFAKILPAGAAILYRMQTQDILTVVFSGRNINVLGLLAVMQKKGLTDWLFGLGAVDTIAGNVLMETDPFDIFKVYGLVGLFLLYILILFAVWRLVASQQRLKREAFDFYVLFYGVVMSAFIVPPMTGHIFTTPGAMIILGLLFGVVASEKMRTEMESYLKQRI